MKKKTLSRIESYFNSPDMEMKRLGQKLCHQFRINYYVNAVFIGLRIGKEQVGPLYQYRVVYKTINYSLVPPHDNETMVHLGKASITTPYSVVYKIKLNKHDGSL